MACNRLFVHSFLGGRHMKSNPFLSYLTPQRVRFAGIVLFFLAIASTSLMIWKYRAIYQAVVAHCQVHIAATPDPAIFAQGHDQVDQSLH